MKKFSLKRVVEYLRYIYTVQAKNYTWNVLAMLFVPLFFGMLNRGGSVVTASGMSLFLSDTTLFASAHYIFIS